MEIEAGRACGDIRFDEFGSTISKRVGRLYGVDFGLTGEPDRRCYELTVGASIDFLTQNFGDTGMIPQASMRVEENSRVPGGLECWIDMPYIGGKPLSRLTDIPAGVSEQLAVFLRRCAEIARASKQRYGSVCLPDLLGGVRHPHREFRNFIVDSQQKLWFVDVYPLAYLHPHHYIEKRRYRRALRKASGKYGGEVADRGRELAEII